MIGKETYTKEWIASLRNKIGEKTDAKLVEKVVRALGLLEELKNFELDFIFKGGTSILLATDFPTRFSIDIDIITEHTQSEIEVVLAQIVVKGSFEEWKPDNNRQHAIDAPVSHYKLYYTSVVDNNYEPILLDVLHTPNPYPSFREVEVKHSWLQTGGEAVMVKMPTFDAILGDKLTAYAPETTGILYSKNRPVEIIKQLYDVALLFERIEDIMVVKESFLKVAQEEIDFRKLNIGWEMVLDDIQRTGYEIVRRDEKSEKFQQLNTGIRNIVNFILQRFKIEEAITAGAKAAYLAELIRQDEPSTPTKFLNPAQVADWVINSPDFPKLAKLKKSNPEAFYYWYRTLELKSGIS